MSAEKSVLFDGSYGLSVRLDKAVTFEEAIEKADSGRVHPALSDEHGYDPNLKPSDQNAIFRKPKLGTWLRDEFLKTHASHCVLHKT